MIPETILFLVFFLTFLIRLLLVDGFAVNPDTGEVFMQPYKYFMNLIEMPIVLAVLLIGVVGVLFGIGKTIFSKTWRKGNLVRRSRDCLDRISVITLRRMDIYGLLPIFGGSYKSSLTIQNSCSRPFTLKVMSYVIYSRPIRISLHFSMLGERLIYIRSIVRKCKKEVIPIK